MKAIAKTDLAWIAGIIDGEGCISIVRMSGGSNRTVTMRYTLHVKVTMGHRPTVQRIADIVGSGTVQNHAARGPRMNASYSWIAQSQKAKDALLLVRPYLVTKAEESDVALAFMNLPLSLRGGRGGSDETDESLLRRREELYGKLRQLKPRWRFYEEKLKNAT